MNALVTAVIPCHNYGRFVATAIDSVLAQTYQPIECVVVDDGSTDNTQEVLAGYGERIRMIRRGGTGPSAARNAGIEAAKGEFIGLIDADDEWKPQKIEKQMALLAADAGLAAVGCATDMIDENKKLESVLVPLRPGPDRDANLRSVAVRNLWVGGSCTGILIRKKVLEELGCFDVTLRAAEDWDLWLRLIAKHRIDNLKESLATVNLHRTGTFRNSAMVEGMQLRVVDSTIARWPDVIGPVTRRKMRSLVLMDAAYELVLARDLVGARRKMRAAVVTWPFDQQRLRSLLSLTARTMVPWKRGARD